jgi:hypothetical protein
LEEGRFSLGLSSDLLESGNWFSLFLLDSLLELVDMTEKKNNINHINSNEEERSNVELIYNYTEALLKIQGESLNRLDTKLSAFLAFAGVSLRFVVDLPNKSALINLPIWVANISLVLKTLACIFCVLSITVCVLGLTAKMRGITVEPEVLMNDTWYWEEPAHCQAFIINTWINASKEYKTVGQKKGKTLNFAIGLIFAAAITFASDTILLIFYT